MKASLVQRLAAGFAKARARDADELAGVYAVPGPRAQGDESIAAPALSAELLDEIRISRVPVLVADAEEERRVGSASERPVVQITLAGDGGEDSGRGGGGDN